MKKNLKVNAILLALLAGAGIGSVQAESVVEAITIHANTDGTNASEWLALRSGNGAGGTGNSSASIDIRSTGVIDAAALNTINITANTNNSVNNGANLDVEGVFIRSNAAAASHLFVGTDGVATLGGSTVVNINSGGTTNIGTGGNVINVGRALSTNNIGGTTNVTGTTSINTASGLSTSIGTLGTSVNLLQGASNTLAATGANSITGATNNLVSTSGANAITAATSNIITAATSNAITAATSNDISAVTNNVSATGENNLTAVTNNMTATTANNIQGPVNNIGTSSVSANWIGNTVANTTVTATAGNASQALANNSANTTVTAGTSGLTARVGTANVTTTGQVLLSNTAGTTVDANGKILNLGATAYVNPAAPTAALTLTNGYGNTHGLVVTESQTTLSGGTQSSSMTLTDRAATFSNAQTGAPITVTGVDDGRADFDAVNVRQFAGAIAAVAAQANIPSLAAGQDRTFGMAVGNFMGKSALAMGMNIRGNGNAVYKVTLSSGLMDGGMKAVVAAGAAWGF
jgi:hypothetical protein